MEKKDRTQPLSVICNHLSPSSRYLLETTNETPPKIEKIKLLNSDEVVIKLGDLHEFVMRSGYVPLGGKA